MAKKDFRKAYTYYKKAAYFDNSRASLYEKLIKVMDDFKDDWSENDFVENIYWAMQLKELQDPTFKRIHFRSEPEFKEVTELIQKMLKATNQADETKAVEAIVGFSDKAIYPLIEFLLTFKNINPSKKNQGDAQV